MGLVLCVVFHVVVVWGDARLCPMGLYLVNVPNRLFSFFVLPQRKKQRKRHFCELLRTQKEPGCVLLWLARPLFASSANASCSPSVVLKFEVMPDGNEILIGLGDGLMCCFSCCCGFGGCPIVPDGWEGSLNQDLKD